MLVNFYCKETKENIDSAATKLIKVILLSNTDKRKYTLSHTRNKNHNNTHNEKRNKVKHSVGLKSRISRCVFDIKILMK